MKNCLLLPVLLSWTPAALAQPTGPWVEVNATNVTAPASFVFYQLVALSPTFAWGLAYDGNGPTAGFNPSTSVRTSNAVGTEVAVNAVVGSVGFKPTNLAVPAGVVGNATAFCGQYSLNGSSGRGGEVVRTTNGGNTWQQITGQANFAGPASFCDWVYFFDANAGLAAGDPNPVPSGGVGQFEFLYTTNASAQPASAVTWARASTPAPYDRHEYPLIGSYTAVGDTLWAGTSHEVGGSPSGASRVLRSTDRGRTWAAYAVPITLGQVQHLAFRDGRHGVAYTRLYGATELMATADGGQTWTLQTLPNPTTADTLRGKFYGTGIAAIPGVGFVSYGAAQPGVAQRTNFGVSFSPTGLGQSWTDLDKGHHAYQAAALLACGAGGYRGYLGSTTARATSASNQGGEGGLFQVPPTGCAAAPLAVAKLVAAPTLAVWPNPSGTGRFQVQIAAGLAAGASLRVTDAVGRTVFERQLGPATGAVLVPVELDRCPAGLYTLCLTTAGGSTARKLVVE